jgi:hypothetical protein
MKTVFYSSSAQFGLTEEEFKNFIKQASNGKKVWIPRLNVFLSDMFIWAGERPNERKLHDGTIAEWKNGQWIDKLTGLKLDQHYYTELTKDIDCKLLENN